MPARIIDKGIPAPGLLAQVIVAKYDDHLPLYRQEEIYARSGVHLPRSSMAQWIGMCGAQLLPLAAALHEYILAQDVVHADETPVQLLAPGQGKTKRAYVWVYRTTDMTPQRAVWFDFTTSRAGENPRRVLKDFNGTLVSDDYAGYHALHRQGVTAAFCMAHARRKFFEAHEHTGSTVANQALVWIAQLYEVEREGKGLDALDRWRLRQNKSRPIVQAWHEWMKTQRPHLVAGHATTRAMDYCLSNWAALTRFIDDGQVPIDNNPAENALRPLAVGRKNWLFVGSQQAGERAAAILSLIESAKLNGHDPWVYMKDLLERLPSCKQRDLHQLLPHHWHPPVSNAAAPVELPLIITA